MASGNSNEVSQGKVKRGMFYKWKNYERNIIPTKQMTRNDYDN